MVERILQIDDIRLVIDPARVMEIFRKLGYQILGQAIAIADLELSSQSTADIYEAHLIADQRSRNRALADLQVLLITLKPEVWESPSVASGRMKAIATSLAKNKSDNYLLIGTNQQHDRLLLVNPRKSLDAQGNVKVSIHKLLIDRANPTAHDRERLEAIAVRHLDPQQLYKAHCEAFDVEKLTKRFYNEYRQLFERVQQVIKDYNDHPYFADAARLHQFSQRLLGRIMFLYFLQKKEFLAGDRWFLSHQYDRLKSQPEDTNYYSELLEPLFFATLNQERPEQNSPWGKVPYLNGGLFDRDYGENIRDAAGRETPRTITLPNSLFDPKERSNSILGFFNGYNFTVSENIQGDEDVAVDPEMLGKVFENMLEAEERGKSGTFYTPRGIVNFMCVEVLSRYLADETGMTPEAIRELMELDPDLSDREFNQKITPTQARELKRAIASVKILDPAVGSGAFPLGMMQVILAVRQAVGRREGAMIRRGSLAMSEVKREIIANNLYGVDIKPEAIEVAKLRMWLSLVVDIPSIEDVEALPNLDYKLMCGDSLISTIHGEQLIPDPTKTQQGMLEVTPIQTAIQPLLDLQQRYYNADTDVRRELRQQIIEAEANIFRVAVSDRLNFWQGEQRKLEQDIKRLGKSTRIQEKKRAEIATKVSELGKFSQEVEKGERSLSFFSYHLHFRDVFEKRGGFDIVVGNPPYGVVFDLGQKHSYESVYSAFKRNNDIYTAFYEQGILLLKKKGHITFITPNTFLNGDYFLELRKIISSTTVIQNLTDYKNVKIFDDPTVFVCIIVLTKSENISYPYTTSLQIAHRLNNFFETHPILIKRASSLSIKEDNVLLSKLNDSQQFNLLDSVCFVKDVGFNYWTEGRGKKRGGDSIGKRVLYKSDMPINESDIPFMKGSDISKWYCKKPSNFLKYDYQNLLDPEIDTFRFSLNFLEETPKIIYRQTASQIIATLDTKSLYLDKTVHLIVPRESWEEVFSPNVLLGIINSSLIAYLYSYISQETEGRTFPQVKITYIKKLPIPINLNIVSQNKLLTEIETLVQKCLDAKGQGVEQWEAEIDDCVAHLYGLTAEEMKIIRGE